MLPSKPPSWKIASVILIGVLGISTAAIWVRLSTEATGLHEIGFSLFLAASRLTISSLLMFPLWKSLSKIKPQSGAFNYSVIAGICLAIHYVTWFSSLSYTSVAASTIIVTTNPIWVTLFSLIFFKEKTSRQTIIGITLAILGGLLIAYDGTQIENSLGKNPLLGNFIALIGAWVYSFYFLAGREAQRRGFPTGTYVIIAYSSAALVLIPLPYLFKTEYTGYPAIVYIYVLLMAIFSQIIGQTSLNWSLRWVSPVTVTLAIMFEPIFAGILAYLFLGETPSLILLVASVILLFGVGIAAIAPKSILQN